MDGAGIAVAIGWPGPVVAADAAAARRRARFLNEFGAGVVQGHPTRFGLFASPPPLTDVDGALLEIAYAFDHLQADGIGLLTHYGEHWLGDPAFVPVFEALNRRAAVVFVHPTASADGCACGVGGASGASGALTYQTPGVSQAWLEYPFNTARCILNLMTTGTFRAFPDIRFIFCHGGGAFTSLLSRITGFEGWFEIGPDKLAEFFPHGVEAEFKQLYFECAQAYAPQNMALLRSLVPDSQILFGTDFDRFSLAHSVRQFEHLQLPADVRLAIASGNARRLFTRLLG